MRLQSSLLAVLFLSTINHQVSTCSAATTINPTNRFTYSANLGWIDWRGDTNNGAVIGEYVCSGYLYAADAGWINLGNGSPTNGIYYQNLSPNDFGVNFDGLGNLTGYAWAANIGWLIFTNRDSHGLSFFGPRLDLKTGRMQGFAYSANCGWISLSNAVAYVQTDNIAPGQMDTNGLPIAWELQNFGHTGVDPNADPDGDGMSNKQEYLAGTNPNDVNDKLVINAFIAVPQGSNNVLAQWTSVPTRCYYFQRRSDLNASGFWFDSGLGLIPSGGATTAAFISETNAVRFYRVQAVRPLGP